MKNFLNKIVAYLCSISTDKYQHFSVGAITASIVAILFKILFASNIVACIFGLLAVVGIAYLKEYVLDDKVDNSDAIATVVGGMVVLLTAIIA